MTRAVAARSQPAVRLRGRSLMAFVLTPTPPIGGWLDELQKWSASSPGFFVGRPIILDLAAARLEVREIEDLIVSLSERGIRVMALEGVDADELAPSLPPLLKPTRGDAPQAARAGRLEEVPRVGGQSSRQEPSSLLVETPIRSGQSVIFPYGDVTVLGSVSSGAEVVAGGSIHIYGALRGRAMAGSMGKGRARIFCTRNEAELISIDGFYRTAEELDVNLRSKATQCWLQDRVLTVAALD